MGGGEKTFFLITKKLEQLNKKLNTMMEEHESIIKTHDTFLPLRQDFFDIIPKIVTAVVTIKDDYDKFLGSGSIVCTNHYIVTSSHILKDNTKFNILFSDNHKFKAHLIKQDKIRDLALLKLENTGNHYHKYIVFSKLSILPGHRIIAVGSPVGLYSTISQGMVSALRKFNDGINLIQIDAALNFGNSGGPIIGIDGGLFGINTSKLSDLEGIAFATHVGEVKQFLASLGIMCS